MRKIMIFFLFFFLLVVCFDSLVCYYLDVIGGDDNNSGLVLDEVWKSLEKLCGVKLLLGNKVLLKCGEVFNGEFEIIGQGIFEDCIYIDVYGDDEWKFCIVGYDIFLYVVCICNLDYIMMQNLEIVNIGRQFLFYCLGLKIECMDYGVLQNIVVNNVIVWDVNGLLVKEKGGGCGIYIVNGGEKKILIFNRLIIENCYILRCICNVMIWVVYSDWQNWYFSKYIVIWGNLIEEVLGDGIVFIGCDSILIEYNVMCDCFDMFFDIEVVVGIWLWSCDNILVQFNEVSGYKVLWDVQGFDLDWNCWGMVIQYNYSYDNYGGLVLVCNDGMVDVFFNVGNLGIIVCYNVSIGDGVWFELICVGMFLLVVYLVGFVKDSCIICNIIYVNCKFVVDIDCIMIILDLWGGYLDSIFISGNIFYVFEFSRFQLIEFIYNFFEGNYYFGWFEKLFEDGKVC